MPQIAHAAPVRGDIYSGVVLGQTGSCTLYGANDAATATFNDRRPPKVVLATSTLQGVDPGTSTDAVTGEALTSSGAAATSTDGALRKATLLARHEMTMTNTSPTECGASMGADSQIGMWFRIKGQDRHTVSAVWSRKGPGRIAQLRAADASGRVVLDLSPKKSSGTVRFRVRPGKYFLLAQFTSTLRESQVAVGSTVSRRTDFSLTVTRAR